MSIEENKAIVRRFIDEVFVDRNIDAVDELVAADFVPHGWGPAQQGRDAVRGAIERTSAALSEVQMTIDDLIAEGDRVAVRLTSSAVQSGPFMGMPPSGKRYEITEIHIFRIRDGKVAEHWHQLDSMAMMQQLGAAPTRTTAAVVSGRDQG